jgi:uncharacterized protein (TIGR01777 family)
MRILITGGTGLIGKVLSQNLLEKGHGVSMLSRNPRPMGKIQMFPWDPDKGYIEKKAFEGIDSIIHLAGEGIAEMRWSEDRKKAIIHSRTDSIRLIYKTLSTLQHSVKTCISSGGIGYYGNRGDEWLSENDSPGKDFLSLSCMEWEKAVDEGESLGLRIAQLRVGMVLSREGGALKPLENLTKYYLGSPLGNGKQWMSWIHIRDLSQIFIQAVENSNYRGLYNAVSPEPVTNRDFTRELAHAMHKPLILPPVPSFVLKAVLGEMAEVILDSNRVHVGKLLNLGFEFEFKTLPRAFKDLYPN